MADRKPRKQEPRDTRTLLERIVQRGSPQLHQALQDFLEAHDRLLEEREYLKDEVQLGDAARRENEYLREENARLKDTRRHSSRGR